MPNCQSCGRESPAGYKFCLNCGSKLHAAVETPSSAAALPPICAHCGVQNHAGMQFCQNCGRPTAASGQAPLSAQALGPTPIASPPPPAAMGPPAAVIGPPPAAPPPNRPHNVTPGPGPSLRPPPAQLHSPSPASLVPGQLRGEKERACPSCGGQTPIGLRFCQRCGGALDPAVAPTSPGPSPRVRAPGPSIAHGPTAPPADSGAAIRSQRWGTLVCLNRDGTQGAEYPLAGEFVDIGTEGQIRFEDPFLAPRHLRLSRESGSVWVVPLDRTNGSFLRVTEQTALSSTRIILLGRELLRFEQLGEDERNVAQAVQHGVHVFGSPVRDVWGRLIQLLPNGCIRDVRHLIGAEVIIGREEGDVVFADDEFLSRRHASLHWRDGRCHIQDLGSSNGSFLRIEKRAVLESGAQLRFGDQMVRIDLNG